METKQSKTSWEATQNRQPPAPFTLSVNGRPNMPTPRHMPVLTRAEPQGINLRILILELSATARPEPGSNVNTRVRVSYEERSNQEYDQVEIRSGVDTEPDGLVDVQVLHLGAPLHNNPAPSQS